MFVVFPEEWPHRANFKPTASEGQVSACLFVGLCGYERQRERERGRKRERLAFPYRRLIASTGKKNLSVLLSDKKEIEPLFLFKPPTWSTGERYTFCAQKLYKGSDMDLPTPTF